MATPLGAGKLALAGLAAAPPFDDEINKLNAELANLVVAAAPNLMAVKESDRRRPSPVSGSLPSAVATAVVRHARTRGHGGRRWRGEAWL